MNNENTTLSPRLKAVAAFVPKGCRLADIGTDHARLPIYLIKNGTIEGAIASDIADGPLEKAAENLRYFSLSKKVELRKADGLRSVYDNEADCAVIAGMGGELISGLLEKYIPNGLKRLIIQPMTDAFMVRHALGKCGYKIIAEEIVPENDKMYIVICAEKGKMRLSDEEEQLSPLLVQHRLYRDYLVYRISRMEKAANQAEKAGAETEMVKEYRLLKKALREIED